MMIQELLLVDSKPLQVRFNQYSELNAPERFRISNQIRQTHVNVVRRAAKIKLKIQGYQGQKLKVKSYIQVAFYT